LYAGKRFTIDQPSRYVRTENRSIRVAISRTLPGRIANRTQAT